MSQLDYRLYRTGQCYGARVVLIEDDRERTLASTEGYENQEGVERWAKKMMAILKKEENGG